MAKDALGRGGDDRPMVGQEHGEKLADAEVKQGSIGVFGVKVLHAAELGSNIEIRADSADRFDGAAAMRAVNGEGVFHAVEARPAQPAAFISADGADEDAVHVKEEGADGEGNSWHRVANPSASG